MATNQKCHLLALSAELRNDVYEIVFSSADTDGEIDLLKAQPPSDALVLTCRQVYGEAALMYRIAYHDFWSKSRFALPWDQRDGLSATAQAYRDTIEKSLKEADVARISSLRVQYGDLPYVNVYAHQIWTFWERTDERCCSVLRSRKWWVATEESEEVVKAGFGVRSYGGGESSVGLTDESTARVEEAKKIVGKYPLSKAQIMQCIW